MKVFPYILILITPLFVLYCLNRSINYSNTLIITDEIAYYSNDDLSNNITAGSKNTDTLPPQLIKKVKPIYPSQALKERIEGNVEIIMLVMNDGTVKRSKILKSSNTVFNRAALAASMQWKFKPAKENDKYINVWIKNSFQFRLNEKSSK